MARTGLAMSLCLTRKPRNARKQEVNSITNFQQSETNAFKQPKTRWQPWFADKMENSKPSRGQKRHPTSQSLTTSATETTHSCQSPHHYHCKCTENLGLLKVFRGLQEFEKSTSFSYSRQFMGRTQQLKFRLINLFTPNIPV